MSEKKVELMSEEELRGELAVIRMARAGKGRQKRKEAKVKRITQVGKDRSKRQSVQAEADADWV